MSDSSRIFQIFDENQKELIHKWEHYFEIYERHFERFVGHGPKVLEIGVYQGGSLNMWSGYFGNDSKIMGLDIDSRCKCFSKGNIEGVIGDLGDRTTLASLTNEEGPFDIIIDDGGIQ